VLFRTQQELVEKQKQDAEGVRRKRDEFSKDVRSQIREKEQARINERHKFFEEGARTGWMRWRGRDSSNWRRLSTRN